MINNEKYIFQKLVLNHLIIKDIYMNFDDDNLSVFAFFIFILRFFY